MSLAVQPRMRVQWRTLREADTISGPHEIDPDKVIRYAAAMVNGVTFPPVRLVDMLSSFLIIDGHHRCEAWRNAPLARLDALVANEEEFEELDRYLRDEGEGRRADDAEFWRDFGA